ncbi:hypothetical protein HNP38_002700 [Chryseobacterium defluvii]|uniref:Uncharacterized protein n=1 Tax=Chryseobacterium defluvii TaxID=160396 RepID=A0A840KE00_9FLAO|nr:hypothetical protein [Chryseobacterium defluvii]
MEFEGINLEFLWHDINEKILDAPNPHRILILPDFGSKICQKG